MNASSRSRTHTLALLALFTAIVAVLQLMGVAIRFGVFAVSLVGVPIIIGGALMGLGAGAWLGFVFGVTGSGPVVIMSVFIGFNFFFELGLDLVLSGVVDRLIQIGKKTLKKA